MAQYTKSGGNIPSKVRQGQLHQQTKNPDFVTRYPQSPSGQSSSRRMRRTQDPRERAPILTTYASNAIPKRTKAPILKISGESVPPYFPILILFILLFIISVSIYRNSKKIETVADVTEERISKLEEDPPTPAKIVIVESENESENSTKMIFLAMFLGGILYFLYKKQ